MDVRKIDPLDVEEFFRWCRQGGGDYRAISNNTIIKVSSLLNGMYQWMLKAPKRYGVTSNPVEGADALKEEFFEGVSLSVFSTKEMGVTGRVYWHDDGNRKESSKWISGRLCKTISGRTDGRKKDISQKESGKGDLPRTA